MAIRLRPFLPRAAAAVSGLAIASALLTPAAAADTAPPRFGSGFGLTVVSQPAWVDGTHRTFVFSVASDQVPNPTLLPGQVAGQHVIMVTLPAGYDSSGDSRYPVLYSLHGNPHRPNCARNQRITAHAT